MTVSTEIDHNEYTGNGATTSFPYTFRIMKNSDLVVQVVDLNENITQLLLDTDYSVTGAKGYSGGSVVLNTPLANGWQISINRSLPVTQETDLRNQGKFFAEVHEDAFDKLTMLIQQCFSRLRLSLRRPSFIANYYDALGYYIRNLRDPSRAQDAATKNYVDVLTQGNFNRSLRVPESYIPPVPNATSRANKLQAYDYAGDPIVVLPESGSAADVMIQLAGVDGESFVGGGVYSSVRNYSGGLNQIKVLGRDNLFDGGGGIFTRSDYDLSSLDDDATILIDVIGRRWKREIHGGTVFPEWWGAKGEGSDDTQAFKKMLSYSIGKHTEIRLSKEYFVNESLTVTLAAEYAGFSTKITGTGRGLCGISLLPQSTSAEVLKIVSSGSGGAYNLFLRDFTIKGNQTAYNSSNSQAAIRAGRMSGFEMFAVDCRSVQIGFTSPDDVWLSRFVMCMFSAYAYGIKMDKSGTSNYFDNLYAYGCNVSAYKLRGSYSGGGSLAADNCTGTIYDLDFFSGAFQSLGSEQPVSGRIPSQVLSCNSGNLSVQFLLAFQSAPTDGSTEWTGIAAGSGNINVNTMRISQQNADGINITVNGRVFRGTSGKVLIENLQAVANLNVSGSPALIFNAPLAQNTTFKVASKWGTDVRVTVGSKPYMGMLPGDTILNGDSSLALRKLQAIYLDSSVSPSGSGIGANYNATRDAFRQTPAQGSWFIENDPLATGRAGYVITSEGTRLGNSGYLSISLNTINKPITDKPDGGQHYLNDDIGKPLWWSPKRNTWIDALGNIVTV